MTAVADISLAGHSADASSNGVHPAASKYTPTQPWSTGLSANRPTVEHLQYQNIEPLTPPTEHDFPPGYLACPGLFSSLGTHNFTSTAGIGAWLYTMRRDAQAILPFLYLGPNTAARNTEFLRSEGITLMLGVRGTHSSHPTIINSDKQAHELGIEADYVVVDESQDLASKLRSIICRINGHVCCCEKHQKGQKTPFAPGPPKKVLVFCETGNERSGVVVVAYLMAIFNMSPEAAMVNVQGQRLCASLGGTFRHALASFADVINAARDVTRANRFSASLTIPESEVARSRSRSRKRSFSSAVDVMEQNDSDGCMDNARFEDRNERVPFADVDMS
ncbi:hypothetical protein AJ80_04763 [Polytolypa hystricis UAMH7299]|uniref:Tyrosine specific protein phosphatases domain-containing protein n=1 Tax=Polytolypa hystricis (strain UAMH7299) TaxID=1447883 RepID=A0A2B7Y8L4_POLH7|nr:hypothetical protein AJ80_04763 [Polytolypa hystricis UAMH7299]